MNNSNEVCHVCGSTDIKTKVTEEETGNLIPFYYSLCLEHHQLMRLFLRFLIENQSEITIKGAVDKKRVQKPPRKPPITARPLKDWGKPSQKLTIGIKEQLKPPKPPTPKAPPLSVRKDEVDLALELIKSIMKYEDLSLEYILLVLNDIIANLIRSSLKEDE